MKRPVISLLTDFGTVDHYAGVMKGVILGICPDAQLVDISHDVTPFAMVEAAWTLGQAWRYFPAGTVHLIVVDPGVGSDRRPIVAEAGGHRFVAPDNGVLSMIFEAEPVHEVREITVAAYFGGQVSRTFHGRDIFAPVAAHLASGVAAGNVGERLDDYVRLDFFRPIITRPGEWSGRIVKIDRFGNAVTNFDAETGRFELQVGNRSISRLASSYAEVPEGELFLIGGSSGKLEISINQGSAAKELGVRPGESLTLWAL